MKYENVIWDWNGTLIDDVRLCSSIFDEMLKEYGLHGITTQDYRDNFKFPIIDFYRERGFDFNKFSFEKIGTEFVADYNKRRFSCDLHTGTRECLAKLNAMGIRQSVLSASQKNDLLEGVNHFGIAKFFTIISGLDDIYATSKVELGKIHIQKLGADKSKTVMIGDTEHDATVAKSMGVSCILIEKGHYSRRRLEKMNVPIVSSHSEIVELVK